MAELEGGTCSGVEGGLVGCGGGGGEEEEEGEEESAFGFGHPNPFDTILGEGYDCCFV